MTRLLGSLLLSALVLPTSACVLDASVETAEGSFSRELTVTGPLTLEVETGSGEVIVRTAEPGIVRIEGRVSARGRFRNDDAENRVAAVQNAPPIEQSGNSITLGRWPRSNNVRISYRVTVPQDTNLRVGTGSGDVAVGDLQGPVSLETGSGQIRIGSIGGDVRARTGSGDVELARSAGALNLRTGSGRVRVQAAGDGRVEVVTGSGDVEVEGAAGPLRVRTGSGSIFVQGSPSAEWDLDAGSGDLRLEVPPAAAFNVNLRTGSGDINAPSVTTTERATRRELRGAVGAGGPLVSMSTGSGAVSIR